MLFLLGYARVYIVLYLLN